MPTTTSPTGPCLIAPITAGRADWHNATEVDMQPVPRQQWNAGGTGKGSRRQQRILNYLRDYIAQHGYPPTLRELADGCGLESPSTIRYHLRILEGQHLIERDDRNRIRGIRLVDQDTP